MTREQLNAKIQEAISMREQALMSANLHEGRVQAYREMLAALQAAGEEVRE